jgi:hypothetical protein
VVAISDLLAELAPLRFRKGGDQANQNTIVHDIASHGIAVAIPVRHHRNHRTIRAELAVFFPPFQLYEFPVMRMYAHECGLA